VLQLVHEWRSHVRHIRRSLANENLLFHDEGQFGTWTDRATDQRKDCRRDIVSEGFWSNHYSHNREIPRSISSLKILVFFGMDIGRIESGTARWSVCRSISYRLCLSRLWQFPIRFVSTQEHQTCVATSVHQFGFHRRSRRQLAGISSRGGKSRWKTVCDRLRRYSTISFEELVLLKYHNVIIAFIESFCAESIDLDAILVLKVKAV
jgi:hypothetical protein